MTNEAFSRVNDNAQLKDQGWAVTDRNAVRIEYVLLDGTKRIMCCAIGMGGRWALEAMRASINPPDATAQAKAYADVAECIKGGGALSQTNQLEPGGRRSGCIGIPDRETLVSTLRELCTWRDQWSALRGP